MAADCMDVNAPCPGEERSNNLTGDLLPGAHTADVIDEANYENDESSGKKTED